jgi:hypothetical protein
MLGTGSRISYTGFGDGVVLRRNADQYEVCFINFGIKEIPVDSSRIHVIEHIPPAEEMDFGPMEKALINVLRTWSDIPETVLLGDRWQGGIMVLQPKDTSLKPKEIPIEVFFNKIIMTRDRLRVMEQRINSSGLSEEEKINLQQYITKIYGSLTTFNVLFKYKDDFFVGESGKD